MKKQYIIPQVKVCLIENTTILAGSQLRYGDQENNGTASVRGYRGGLKDFDNED